MRSPHRWTLRTAVALGCLVGALAVLSAAQASSTPVIGGTFTSADEGADGPGTCRTGFFFFNCNIYLDKRYVWLNGGSGHNSLTPTNGKYFFAVLGPGWPTPNDGGSNNLSDDYDCWQNRVFKLTNGVISNYPSTGGTPDTTLPANCFPSPVTPFQHWLDSGAGPLNRGAPDNNPPLLRLFPYSNSNFGGIYIMAVCSLSKHTPPNIQLTDCKYDAFKVPQADDTPPACQLTSIIGGPPKQIQITVQDPESGLESVEYSIYNGTASPDSGPFTTNPDGSVSGSGDLFVGMVTPFVLTATKTNQSVSSRIVVTARDIAGRETVCDPVLPATKPMHAKPAHPLASLHRLWSLLTRIFSL
jgi:hypothetical protein